jgi:hypothetical protein
MSAEAFTIDLDQLHKDVDWRQVAINTRQVLRATQVAEATGMVPARLTLAYYRGVVDGQINYLNSVIDVPEDQLDIALKIIQLRQDIARRERGP